MTNQQIIAATQAWLKTFVIEYNICPFARREQEKDSIRYQVVSSNSIEDSLEAVIAECVHLDSEPDTETTLLIFSEAFADFEDFLDLLAIAEQLLIDQGYEGIYQLASFHPDYCFAQTPTNDPSNYTNRSPYPMLHLIREDSIEKAVASHPDPEGIPERNIALTRELGLEKLRAIVNACYQQ
ncbi:DUF1415 domain-containing protein [Methylomonas sp. MO1]|uniref:DUF1415 domain-containing protein n=1 Tax=unclassified Methylomonas TaxID=2608980 RepID=UPI00047E6A34|nr:MULTISPECIES: DUF1415 domain-containing protein [unclassified Methylomonas]MDT4290736.1 DUF1415 domain-containing protein [Methylomonas sp. MO1]